MQFIFATSDEKLHVDRTDKALTTNGGFAAFASFLNRSKIIDKFVVTCPINRTSNNATSIRDIIISFLLTCFVEGRRFRHVSFIQNDVVIEKLFKLDRRVCGVDTFDGFSQKSTVKLEKNGLMVHLRYFIVHRRCLLSTGTAR